MSMASVSADDHNIHDNNSNNSHGDVNNLLHHDKTLGDGVGGVSIVGMPVVVNPVAAIPVNVSVRMNVDFALCCFAAADTIAGCFWCILKFSLVFWPFAMCSSV